MHAFSWHRPWRSHSCTVLTCCPMQQRWSRRGIESPPSPPGASAYTPNLLQPFRGLQFNHIHHPQSSGSKSSKSHILNLEFNHIIQVFSIRDTALKRLHYHGRGHTNDRRKPLSKKKRSYSRSSLPATHSATFEAGFSTEWRPGVCTCLVPDCSPPR